MKKLFSFLVACLCVTSMWGTEETLTLTGTTGITTTTRGTPSTGSDMEISATNGNVTVTGTLAYFSQGSNGVQIYKNGTMTVSVPSAYEITSIVMNLAGTCYPFAETPDNALTLSTKGQTNGAQDATYTISPAASSVTFTNASAGQTKVKKLIVTYNQKAGGSGSSISSASTLEIPYTETSETFAVTWTNMESTDVYLFDDAECNTTFSGDWFAAELDANDDDVEYIAEENTTGEDRVVYMQLYGLDSEANEYTKVVTVTQKHLVVDYTTLPLAVAAGKTTAQVKEIEGITGTWDGSDYNNNTHKIKFSKNTHYMVIKTNAQIGSCTFSILGAAGAGDATMTIQESTDGTAYTDVQSFTVTFSAKDEVKEVIVTNAFNAASRYIKFKSDKATGNVNFGLGKFTINAYEAPEAVAISAAGYATYSSNKAKYVAAPAKAYIFTTELEELEDGIIPANTGVVLEGTSASLLTIATDATVEGNNLKGAATAMTAAEMVAANPGATKFYGLSLNADGDANSVGFYWMNETGAAFDAAAGKAYLALTAAAAPARILFNQNPVATGIENAAAIKATKALVNGNIVIIRNGAKFNLNGMLVK